MKKEISFFPEVIYSNTVFHLKTQQKDIKEGNFYFWKCI